MFTHARCFPTELRRELSVFSWQFPHPFRSRILKDPQSGKWEARQKQLKRTTGRECSRRDLDTELPIIPFDDHVDCFAACAQISYSVRPRRTGPEESFQYRPAVRARFLPTHLRSWPLGRPWFIAQHEQADRIFMHRRPRGEVVRICRVADSHWRPGRVHFLTLLEPSRGQPDSGPYRQVGQSPPP